MLKRSAWGIRKPALQILAVIVLIGAAVLSMVFNGSNLNDGPSDAALQKGEGVLDGLIFATTLAPKGKPGAIQDAVFFGKVSFYLWNVKIAVITLPQLTMREKFKVASNFVSKPGVRQKNPPWSGVVKLLIRNYRVP